MKPESYSIALENGLDLRQLCTTGSMLHINEDYDDDISLEPEKQDSKQCDYLGQPVKSIKDLQKHLTQVDLDGHVKKRVIEEGGGMPLHEGCTIYIAYTGFWENENEPFDVRKIHKPLVVDLKDNDLLPGLVMAVKSMLVGEVAVFLLSYKLMYGELGIPPRIKPKTDCIFYIKVIKSILTPKEGEINFSEPNMFERVFKEVAKLYSSGVTLHRTKNYNAAVQLFRKSVFMLHKCRLADEIEEEKQEKMLKKLYMNLAVCYNFLAQPCKTCIACNELHRLNSLWNNSKALYHNAKALRMIGQFDVAEKKLKRAKHLSPENEDIAVELNLLEKTRNKCDQNKLIAKKYVGPLLNIASDEFKLEVDTLIKNFKENPDLCKLTLPGGLNSAEMEYLKQACIEENLFFNRIKTDYALDKAAEEDSSNADSEESPDNNVHNNVE